MRYTTFRPNEANQLHKSALTITQCDEVSNAPALISADGPAHTPFAGPVGKLLTLAGP